MNFVEVFNYQPFARQYFNSLYIALTVTALTLVFSSLSGYATTQSGARFAFAILMNGHELSDSEAHEAQDKIAALVAAQP